MGGKKQTVSQKTEPWRVAQPYLRGAMGEARELFENGQFAPDPFQGQRVAGFGAATQGAQQGILDRAAGGAPGVQDALSAMRGMMGGGQYAGMQGVRDNILGSAIPAATSMFSGSGMTNSSTAMDGVGRAATEALAPFEYGAYENAQNRIMQAAGMMPSLEQAAYLPMQMQGQVGAQQDAMRQAQIDAEMRKYYEGEGQAAANFSPYLQAIMGLGGMGSSGSTTSPVPGTGLGPAVMGGLGMYGTLAGAGMSGGMAGLGGILAGLAGLSDRRAKEDIERIGATNGGIPLYRYRYKGTDNWHIGVMADEVPHAIKGYVNGFALVDYGRIA
ncbi:MAG: tail fiber domain-containing protein [Synechococcaceae cyanobacterium SM1_2_3]|nr:tail fiber domain-containing protein [Synechococcaceae cyanobacterium SM1_2_3]